MEQIREFMVCRVQCYIIRPFFNSNNYTVEPVSIPHINYLVIENVALILCK